MGKVVTFKNVVSIINFLSNHYGIKINWREVYRKGIDKKVVMYDENSMECVIAQRDFLTDELEMIQEWLEQRVEEIEEELIEASDIVYINDLNDEMEDTKNKLELISKYIESKGISDDEIEELLEAGIIDPNNQTCWQRQLLGETYFVTETCY